MPKAKIVICKGNTQTTLNKLVQNEVVKKTTIKGVDVYSRVYLTTQQIKNAYARQR